MKTRDRGCGCCGIEIAACDLWCGKCLDDHVGTHGALSDRTYFAQFGVECPYQVRFDEDDEDDR